MNTSPPHPLSLELARLTSCLHTALLFTALCAQFTVHTALLFTALCAQCTVYTALLFTALCAQFTVHNFQLSVSSDEMT